MARLLRGRYRLRAVLPALVRYQTPNFCVRFLTTQEATTFTERFWRRLWRTTRAVFILTGGLVWVSTLTRLYGRRNREDSRIPDNVSSVNDFFGLTEKGLRDRQNVEDLVQKNRALHDLWDRLKKEEAVEDAFGSQSEICGFRLHNWREDTPTDGNADHKNEMLDVYGESGLNWTRSFIVEGPKLVGQLDTTFEFVKDAWIPTTVKLHPLSRDGTALVDVSAPPPNGVSKFTRLSTLK